MGSEGQWPDVGSGGLRYLLRSPCAELLYRLRAQSAVREQRHVSESTELRESMARFSGRQSVPASPDQRQQFRHVRWIREHAFQREIDILATMEPEFTETDWSKLAGFDELRGDQRHSPVERKPNK